MHIKGFEIPQGFKIVNPKPVDSWSGPYVGETREQAVSLALSEIPVEVRYKTMQVRIVYGNTSDMYWFRDGVENEHLILYIPTDIVSGYTSINERLNEEISEREQGDLFLLNLITGPVATGSTGPSFILDLITGETKERIEADNKKLDLTGGTINGDLSISGGTIYGDGSGLFNIPASAVADLKLDRIVNGDSIAIITPSGLTTNVDVYANRFVKSGATHDQILMGDGSVKDISFFANTGITINAGAGISGGGDLSSDITISHGNTSNATSVRIDSEDGKVISGISIDVDEFGHMTLAKLNTVDLDERYLTSIGNTLEVGLYDTDNFLTADKPINAGAGLVGGGMLLNGVTISHADTSNIWGLISTGTTGNVLSGINLSMDDFGHVTGATANRINLDGRYLQLDSKAVDSSRLDGMLVSDITGMTIDEVNLMLNYLSGETLDRVGENYLNLTGGTLSGPLYVNGQLVVYVSGNTAPIVINSNTKIDNLNADMLDGYNQDFFVNTGRTISAGAGMSGGGNLGGDIVISHKDTSNVTGLSSLSNSGGVVLQNISILVDDFGHITGATLSSANLDNRFLGLNSTSINSDKLGGYTLSQLTGFTEDRYLSISGGTLVGPLLLDGVDLTVNSSNLIVSGGTISGDGAGLYNVPASGVTDLRLNQIIGDAGTLLINQTGVTTDLPIEADSFITKGGTGEQLVMGDGSLMSTGQTLNILSNSFVNKTGDTISGQIRIINNGLRVTGDTSIDGSFAVSGNEIDIKSLGSGISIRGGIVYIDDIEYVEDNLDVLGFVDIDAYKTTINGNSQVKGDLEVLGRIYNSYLSGTNTGDETHETIIQKIGYTPSNENHKHSQLHQPDGTTPFVYTDNNKNLHIDGNIIQSGAAYVTHSENIYTNNNYIYLREGAEYGLSVDEYAGIEAVKYDGVNNGRLVFNKDGVAKVGDVGSEQSIATREDTPVNGGIAVWNSETTMFETVNEYDLSVTRELFDAIGEERVDRINSDNQINDTLSNLTSEKLEANPLIQSGSGTNIVFDEKGLVLSGGPAIYSTDMSDEVISIPVGGAYEMPASEWKKRTIVEVLDAILFPITGPTYVIPTINITSSHSGVKEVGTYIKFSLAINAIKNDAGNFTDLTLIENTSEIAYGIDTTGETTNLPNQFGYVNPNNPNIMFSMYHTGNTFVNFGLTSWKAYGSYLPGQRKIDSKGVLDDRMYAVRDASKPQLGDDDFYSNTVTIDGVFPYFYGKSNSSVTFSDVANIIQSGSSNGKVVVQGSGAGSLSIPFNAVGQWIWFAIHDSVEVKDTWYETPLNNGEIGKVTDLISAPTQIPLESPDNLWSLAPYKVYVAQKVTTIGLVVIS